MSQPSATVIADSVSERGDRLTTMEVKMHRFVLAEFNTHRVFSRNSASSRAIPLRVTLKRVEEDLAFPLSWPEEKKGMQGGEPLNDMRRQLAIEVWEKAAENARISVGVLQNIGLHKSVANRLLEPFMWHTVIVTSTEWDGFWWQRLHKDAQPEMRAAAVAMREAFDASIPTVVREAQWHTPYVDDNEADEMSAAGYQPFKLSAARCARVSTLTHDGIKSYDQDWTLYKRLAYRPEMVLFDLDSDPPHASPLEHVATPLPVGYGVDYPVPGNFRGWLQLRHIELGF